MATLTIKRHHNLTVCEAATLLTGTVFFHWYVDGQYVAGNTSNTLTLSLPSGHQKTITCQDTTDADYDPIANAPEGWPDHITIWWARVTDSSVVGYRVECSTGGDYAQVGWVWQSPHLWIYTWRSDRLADLANYSFRVYAVDEAGNSSSAVSIAITPFVRRPDAPTYTLDFDDGALTIE